MEYRITELASAIGAVNTVYHRDGKLIGTKELS